MFLKEIGSINILTNLKCLEISDLVLLIMNSYTSNILY